MISLVERLALSVAELHASVTQQRDLGTLTFWWRYLTDKAFVQAVEVAAYRRQIEAGASAYECALSLASGYGLNLSTNQACKELTQ